MKEAFLRALAENEDDTTTRLVFADWLEENGEYEEAERQRAWPAAKAWLVDFAEQCGFTGIDDPVCIQYYGPRQKITYEIVVKAGYDFASKGEYFTQTGAETARDLMYNDHTRSLFWHHWQIVTGICVPSETKEGTVFSCSC